MRGVPCLLLLLLSSLSDMVDSAAFVSESYSRLPMSLSPVINDLEAEEIASVVTACLVTSKGVTKKMKSKLLQEAFGVDNDVVKPDADLKAFATASGLVVGLGSSSDPAEVSNTVMACGGTVLYYPALTDLSRGEGLFDVLGPAMERLLGTSTKSESMLVVMVPEGSTESETRQLLEEAASSTLSNLVQTKSNAKMLNDVFASVQYVNPSSGLDVQLVAMTSSNKVSPSEAASTVANTVRIMSSSPSSSSSSPSSLSISDWAMARTVGPAARQGSEQAVARVREVTSNAPGGLETDFGKLCEAVVNLAVEDLPSAAGKGVVGARILSQFKDELYSDLADIAEEQMELLQVAMFEAFRKKLSGLKLSPTLPKDMDAVVNECIKDFAKAAAKMMPKGAGAGVAAWTIVSAKAAFARQMKEFCSERLEVARASGQFRPLPRKGLQVGLHWLLPKPFGNDFRQEPWDASFSNRDLVYVPKDKLTDVDPKDVETGDWRRQIVPSPFNKWVIMGQGQVEVEQS